MTAGPSGITGRTRILGLIADPVVQARSPALANALLRELGMFGDFVLLPMQVPAGALREAITGLRLIRNFAGAIVSMPHKTAVVPLLDELTSKAQLVGAVNVVARSADGRLIGSTLDGEGFVAGMRAAGHEIRGASCLLVGAGGAASAIVFALAAHGCASLTIENRTASKAGSLASRVRAAFPDVAVHTGDAAGRHYDLAINATSLGMKADDALPLSRNVIERTTLVADCVLAPEMTHLLEVARDMGRPVHTGVPMLTSQMDLILRFMGIA